MNQSDAITSIINKKAANLDEAEQHIYEHVYRELRRLAKIQKYKIRNQPVDTTMLVHEAWLKLKKTNKDYNDRAHFFAVASLAMKHILISQAQKKKLKIADVPAQEFTEDERSLMNEIDWLLDVDEQLTHVAKHAPRLKEVFVFRFFGGMTHKEIAEVLNVDIRTIDRDWKKIKVLLATGLTKKMSD